MRFKAALMKSTELGLSLSMIVVLALAACGGGGSQTYIVATQLFGTNGDMSKYLGKWVSGCGVKYTLLTPNTVRADGIINTFDLTAISGVSVQGTLTVDTYNNSTHCSVTATQAIENIFLQYASHVAITDQNPFYTGSADRINLGTVGSATTTPYNIGFRSNFSQFQLTAASNDFYSTTLIYTKK